MRRHIGVPHTPVVGVRQCCDLIHFIVAENKIQLHVTAHVLRVGATHHCCHAKLVTPFEGDLRNVHIMSPGDRKKRAVAPEGAGKETLCYNVAIPNLWHP